MSNYSYITTPSTQDQPAACEVTVIHEDRVKLALAGLLAETAASDLAETFQALADPTRLKLISALMAAEMCVCDLAVTLGMSQSAVSHQLKLLRTLRIVKNRKEGRVVYYSLDDEHIRQLFQMGLAHHQHSQSR